MTLALIVAVDRGGVIGRDGAMPWHLPADLAHFKRVTMGHPIIMGRRTWDSLPGPLPGRRHLVLTRRAGWQAPGATACASLDEALAHAAGGPPPFVIGGAQIYALALPRATRLLMTRVLADVPGDARFPGWDDGWASGAAPGWRVCTREVRPADARNPYDLVFEEYVRPEPA